MGKQSESENTIPQNKTGMFVASKNSKIYHSPDCQYVKRIKDENKIFFKSAEDARKKGYTPHSCVK
jgi:methylphosphotriester-DNA--protein-cysteine methyltransferase